MTKPSLIILLMVAGLLPASGESSVYLERIKPVLRERCYACHGALKQEADLRLDTAENIHAGGVIVKGDPNDSALYHRTSHTDPEERMPPEGKALEPETLEAIREWITLGASIPEDEQSEEDPGDHWAFQRIERPGVPHSDASHPIDAFLTESHIRLGLQPQPTAERGILLRRLYLNLIGLAPTPEQLEDSRAWETIVDELLTNPQHGERWGRHWMDIWRYSDWYGLGAQLRYSQKHLWHWRDWILESLNADKGYDQMILEMLAGDELAPKDPQIIRATGFLARQYYLFNRTTWLDGTIEHTGKAFLGLTLNCAKCHDHKYDPLSHKDYYQFRAIFEPHQVRLDPVPGETDLDKAGLPRAYDDHLDAVTHLHRRGDPKNPDTKTRMQPSVPAIFASFAPPAEPIDLTLTAHTPGARTHVHEAHLVQAKKRLTQAQESLDQAEALERASIEVKPPKDYYVHDNFDSPNETLWEIEGDDWAYRDGALHKNKATRENNVVLLRQQPPTNFELTCRYTATTGTTFKSIGFKFDRSGDGKFQHQVYTSAHDTDPKVQISHTVNGKDQYPRTGYSSQPQIRIGQSYELRFAVSDLLVNVWLDGQFVLSYNLPNRYPGGRIAFSAFDATAAFDEITVKALSPELKLNPATNKAAVSITSAKVAALNVSWQKAELRALQAVIAADRAQVAHSSDADDLATKAIQSQRDAQETKHQLALAKDPKAKAPERPDKPPTSYQPIHASRKALETPEHKFEDYPATYPKTSTGRRLALARWIVHRDNPLTARVAVNHVWTRHFGKPLVESVFDFGRRAKRPKHLALLDYLAVELIESDWSLRHLHRLMLTSQAYQRSSSMRDASSESIARDPDNAHYWRMPTQRMESELVRDNLLHLAGQLDATMSGPSLDPEDGGHRRSLYFTHSRDQKDQFLGMFDMADHLRCYRRKSSIIPQQALALSNSKLAFDMADKMATRLTAANTPDFIRTSFLSILGRPATPAERKECETFQGELSSQLDALPGTERQHRVRARLVHALLNHNDFVTIR